MSKLNAEADYFIISDAHVGCHNCMDLCNYDKLLPFLKEVLEKTKATLILNGDFFEYTKERKSKVRKKNLEIFEILEKIENKERLIRIKGNHDRDGMYEKTLINGDILVFHGDTFGNHTSIFPFFNLFLNWSVAFTEKLFKMNINDILKKCTGYDRKKARKDKMRLKAKEFLEKHPEYKTLIVGHSHTPEADENYFNSGCFVNKESDYIEISGEKITLKTY